MPSLIDKIRAESAAARERIAAELLNREAVKTAMVKAAGLGLNSLRLVPPHPVDLRQTAAAAELVKFVQDSGARVTWSDFQGTDASGRTLTGWALDVDWSARRL